MVLLGVFSSTSSKHCSQIVTSRQLLGHCLFHNTRVCVSTRLETSRECNAFGSFRCSALLCSASQCRLGSVVDNSGREQWNSWPEECSLVWWWCSRAEQQRGRRVEFLPACYVINQSSGRPAVDGETHTRPPQLLPLSPLSTFILLPSFLFR